VGWGVVGGGGDLDRLSNYKHTDCKDPLILQWALAEHGLACGGERVD
jgi:hypothetical protein